MEDFDSAKDRTKQARDAATLARLREAAPGAADALASAVQAEPSPARVHVALFRKHFPLVRLPVGWIPDLLDLANLQTLRAFFGGKKKQSAPPRVDAQQQHAQAIEELTRHFRR